MISCSMWLLRKCSGVICRPTHRINPVRWYSIIRHAIALHCSTNCSFKPAVEVQAKRRRFWLTKKKYKDVPATIPGYSPIF